MGALCPVLCALPTKLAAPWDDATGTLHVFMTVLAGRNSRSSQKPGPFLTFIFQTLHKMDPFVRTHIAFGASTARGLGNVVFSFPAFQDKEVHWKKGRMR